MKKLKLSSLLVGIGMVTSSTLAIQQLSGEITEDLDFPRGVLLTDTVMPEDQSAETGISTVKLKGIGSITVSSRKTGGFPKIRIAGGTTISSSRVFDKTDMKSWWEGQFDAPSTTKSPAAADIEFNAIKNSKDSIQVVETFSWGLGNEEFSFSSPAQVLFPVDEVDNVVLYPAYFSGGKWSVQSESSCVVEDNLCYLEISKMNSLSLVKRLYDTCPQGTITNGKRGNVPSCVISCSSGYKISENRDSCESITSSNNEDGGAVSEKSQNLLTENTSENSNEAKTYKYREGYFRYIGTRNHRQRLLDESGVTGENLDEIKHLNKSYLMRHPRSAEEQVKKDNVKKDNDDGFMNYLLEMRNTFGEGSSGNSFVAGVSDSEIKSKEGELSDNEENGEDSSTYHSSGRLLPSTGPEIFVIIAILGLILMLFGAKRRD